MANIEKILLLPVVKNVMWVKTAGQKLVIDCIICHYSFNFHTSTLNTGSLYMPQGIAFLTVPLAGTRASLPKKLPKKRVAFKNWKKDN